MNGLPDIEPTHPNTRFAMDSTLIEKALEYQLVGELIANLLTRGQRCEVLHGMCDRDGYDVVIEAGGIMRHIQFKARVQGGKAARFDIATRLADKPSGCVILISWDPATVRPTGFRFFGCPSGGPLPDLGQNIAAHSRGNAQGVKGKRSAYRSVSISRFERVPTFDALIDCLFGPAPVTDDQQLSRLQLEMVG